MENNTLDALGITNNEKEEKVTYVDDEYKKHGKFIASSQIFSIILLIICLIGGVAIMADESFILGLLALIGGVNLFIISYGITCIVENTERDKE